MLNSFTFSVFAGLLLSLVLLRTLFVRLATLRPLVALRPASLLRDSAD